MRMHTLRKILVQTAFLVVTVLSSTTAVASQTTLHPGDLDPTFGNGGIVITGRGFDPQLDDSFGTAIQSDGKIVVVGEGSAGSFNWDFAIVRYNPDGSLDGSFGGRGFVITQLSAEYDGASAVAIQADGKIVVAGSRYDGIGGSSFAVVRYLPNGSLDPSFNSTGVVIASGNSIAEYPSSVVIQADGKIVVAGGNLSADFVLIRLNPNGSLDTGFNGTGKVTTLTGISRAASVVSQADGKLVAAGRNTLVRYNTDLCASQVYLWLPFSFSRVVT